MESIVRFISKRLRLKVNPTKSAVARPEERHFLGFRLRREALDGSVEGMLSERLRDPVYKKVQQMTPERCGEKVLRFIRQVNADLEGWIGSVLERWTAWNRSISIASAQLTLPWR